MKDTKEFSRDLTKLINKHSIDNELKSPDYILSRHLVKYLYNLYELKEDELIHKGLNS